MNRAPLRLALGVAAIAACGAVLVLAWPALARGDRFVPGELDVLLAARSFASGRWLPLWAGAVHPDAVGTWLGAAVLSLLLRLGLPDSVALSLLGASHFALLCAAAAGLATRAGGRRVGLGTAALLLLAAPALVDAHSRYLATTVEAAGPQLLLLWLLFELRVRATANSAGWAGSTGLAFALGIGLGLALVGSVHSLWLVVFVAAALTVTGPLRRRPILLLAAAVGFVLAWLPWMLVRDPLGPQIPLLSVKGRDWIQLAEVLGPTAAADALLRLPGALWWGPPKEHLPKALGLLYGLWTLAALVAWLDTLRRSRRCLLGGDDLSPDGLLAVYLLGIGGSLMLAGALLDYPEAYRYHLSAAGPAAVLLALRGRDWLVALGCADGPRATGARLALAAMLLPSLLALPHYGGEPLRPGEAAAYAGQHRITGSQHPVHQHALWLLRGVEEDEVVGFSEGYGLHLGRSFGSRRALALQEVAKAEAEVQSARRAEGVALSPPPDLDARLEAGNPEAWLAFAEVLPTRARPGFLRGLGLGLGEDGALDADDELLLRAAIEANQPWLCYGLGAAQAELERWAGARRDELSRLLWSPSTETAAAACAAAWQEGYEAVGSVGAAPFSAFTLDPPLRYTARAGGGVLSEAERSPAPTR